MGLLAVHLSHAKTIENKGKENQGIHDMVTKTKYSLGTWFKSALVAKEKMVILYVHISIVYFSLLKYLRFVYLKPIVTLKLTLCIIAIHLIRM